MDLSWGFVRREFEMTKLRNTVLLSTCVLWFAGLVPAQAQIPVPAGPEVGARGFVLLDHDSGRILASKNENERMDPASITKLMTAYVVFRTPDRSQWTTRC